MENRSKEFRGWVLVLGFLLILSIVGAAVVFAIQQSLQQAQQVLAPVSDMTSNLGTQVSQALNPTPTVIPDPITVIQQVRSLARLETIQYSVEKVITAEIGQGAFGFLFGDKMLFVAHGEVIAGVDLAKMQPADLVAKNGVLYVHLPDAEVFIASLDNEKSYVYNRDTGVFTRGDVNLETTARRAAEQEILKAAVEDGILPQAKQNAQNYLFRLFTSLGYHDVVFIEATPAP
jgi:hypothetical protein